MMGVWGDFTMMFIMAFAASFGMLTGLFFFICFVEWWRGR